MRKGESPDRRIIVSDHYYQEGKKMAYKITDDCVSCGSCADNCPVGAISEGAEHYEINADACLDCGSCAAGCPSGAIVEG